MQTKQKTIRIRDNLERENPEVTVIVHQGPDSFEVPVIHVDANRYKINFKSSFVGVAVMEVLFDGEQIPESPFRMQIDDLDCDIDYPGQRKSSTESGQCVCASNTIDLFGKCIESWVFAVSISAVAIVLVTMAGTAYVRYRTHKNDEMWMVNIDEVSHLLIVFDTVLLNLNTHFAYLATNAVAIFRPSGSYWARLFWGGAAG
jgi:hypothetical protein